MCTVDIFWSLGHIAEFLLRKTFCVLCKHFHSHQGFMKGGQRANFITNFSLVMFTLNKYAKSRARSFIWQHSHNKKQNEWILKFTSRILYNIKFKALYLTPHGNIDFHAIIYCFLYWQNFSYILFCKLKSMIYSW